MDHCSSTGRSTTAGRSPLAALEHVEQVGKLGHLAAAAPLQLGIHRASHGVLGFLGSKPLAHQRAGADVHDGR